ncbi:MAG: hypothetical protein GX485_03100 [Clostridiales bacterium]|jgi:tRNA(Ile2) C34 agmatinyltransferase TiaS|nr:hypothetical protein [Clostridiales bacterium]
MNEYCPVCGSIDISAGRCLHCGSAAKNRRDAAAMKNMKMTWTHRKAKTPRRKAC